MTKALVTTSSFSLGLDLAPGLSLEQRRDLREAEAGLAERLASVHSRRAYATDWRAWCDWVASRGSHFALATPVEIQRYLNWMATEEGGKRARPSRARALAVLRTVYGAIVVAGLLPVNPAREVKNPKVSKDPKTPWLGEDAIAKLFPYPPPTGWLDRRDWLIALVTLTTGLRRSNVAGLRWEMITPAADQQGWMARVIVKGGKEGHVLIPPFVAEELALWRLGETTGPVFPRAAGNPHGVDPKTVRNAIRRAAERAGLDLAQVTPHALRRTLATVGRRHGVSLGDMQTQLLHTSQTTTERYDKAFDLPERAPGEVFRDLIRRK